MFHSKPWRKILACISKVEQASNRLKPSLSHCHWWRWLDFFFLKCVCNSTLKECCIQQLGLPSAIAQQNGKQKRFLWGWQYAQNKHRGILTGCQEDLLQAEPGEVTAIRWLEAQVLTLFPRGSWPAGRSICTGDVVDHVTMSSREYRVSCTR